MMDLTDETIEDVAVNFLREAFLQGKHGPAEDWLMWERAQEMAQVIEKAVREQVTLEIGAEMTRDDALKKTDFSEGLWSGLNNARHIARGES